MQSKDNTPIRLDVRRIVQDKAPDVYRRIPGFVFNWLESKIHQQELNEIFRLNADKMGVDFVSGALNYLNVRAEAVGLDNLPTNQRFVFACNHPLGGLDGLCLSLLLGKRYEGQISFLVNDLLYHIPNLRSIFIPVNKYGMQSRQTHKMIDDAFRSQRQVITFPAGLCSRRINGKVQDLAWGKMFVQKAVEHQRDVVPIHFEGENSCFFYRLANLRKWLGIGFNFEMLYLPDEMFRNSNRTFRVHFGRPISWEQFHPAKTWTEWAAEVRKASYALQQGK